MSTVSEKQLLEIYRHFRCTAEDQLTMNNILAVTDRILSPRDFVRVNELLSALINDEYITENLALTVKGEEYLYGKFVLEQGCAEFMKIFSYFKCRSGHSLEIQNIYATMDKLLSPLSVRYIETIIEQLNALEFIITDQNSYILTDKGEDYIYN